MFQGTGSDVGKSLIVAGLARALANRGLKVRPFKPQNMSNNAAVTADGGEIGRAQALQARAARAAPSVHMNPVLLKPQSEVGAQVVVRGCVHGTAKAAAYQRMKPDLAPFVLDSYARLKAEADIDRGGVIASLVGTKTVIDVSDAAQIRGFLVNKFRGDPVLFADGMATIARATGWEPLGLVPFFPDARLLPAEDALALDGPQVAKSKTRVRIAVPILPHVSNFDDLDPLDAEPAVDLVRIRPGNALPGDADLVILLGAKATIADLAALRDAGFDIDIAAHARRGGSVLGLCGGYQMLGRTIRDPLGVEGHVGAADGLGLLDIETTLTADKRLERVHGETSDGAPVSGYEMHMGVTEGPDCARPFARLSDGSSDGAVSADGRIIGTYIHGLFADDRQRSAWLRRFAAGQAAISYDRLVDETLDRLAAHLAAHIDIDRLLSLSR
jgi:adenosylcobyric acid synthase